MPNKVTIHTLPLKFTERVKKSSNFSITQKIAIRDLEAMKNAIQREIEHEIPINFSEEINLTISINITNFNIKIDYSNIESRKTIKLLKLYLSNEKEKFANEWAKLSFN